MIKIFETRRNKSINFSIVFLQQIRINKPDLVLFVGEALVGNEAVDQLVKFNQALADFASVDSEVRLIDGIILTKFDTIDDKVDLFHFFEIIVSIFNKYIIHIFYQKLKSSEKKYVVKVFFPDLRVIIGGSLLFF